MMIVEATTHTDHVWNSINCSDVFPEKTINIFNIWYPDEINVS